MISLVPSGTRVKIGRQTNNKTVPGERNGYFDSKVLSRQHAEVWEENSKVGQGSDNLRLLDSENSFISRYSLRTLDRVMALLSTVND